MAYQFTANQTYLIGFSDRYGGGNLTFTIEERNLPGWRVMRQRNRSLPLGGSGIPKFMSWIKTIMKLLQLVGMGKDYTILSDVPAGKYKVITSSWGFYHRKSKCHHSGIITDRGRQQLRGWRLISETLRAICWKQMKSE